MTATDKLYVEVLDDEIIVTLPGTSYAVTYYRATAFPQRLLTKSHSGGEDHDAPMTQAEFHGRAWRLANDKARERGWIVQASRRCAGSPMPFGSSSCAAAYSGERLRSDENEASVIEARTSVVSIGKRPRVLNQITKARPLADLKQKPKGT